MTASQYSSLWRDLAGTAYTQGWLESGDIATRYLKSGADDAYPLILLHGVGGHAEAYARNLKSHGERFCTWAIDMVGHGWTRSPSTPREIPVYVDHILRFMDSAGIDCAHISGESLGGWVASRLAIDHPDRVNRLVLNTTGGSQADPAVMARLKELSLRAATDPSWDFIKARVEWLMADKSKATEDLIACRQWIYSQPGMEQIMVDNLVLQEMDIRVRNLIKPEDYAAIAAETLVLWTSDDPTADVSEGQRIASMIPGSQFTVMDGCGHWPQWEDVPTFDRIHLNFLEGKPIDQPR